MQPPLEEPSRGRARHAERIWACRMKHYITYDEALSYFKQEILKGAFPADVEAGQVLLNNLRDNHLFTVLHNAGLLFQKEALLSHHKSYSGTPSSRTPLHGGDLYLDHYISTLSLKHFDDGTPGIPIIEDIVCDYIFQFPEFRKSLKREGVYPLLNCMCEEIYCGGLFVEVKHVGKDAVGWVLAYYQRRYPRTYIRGMLFGEREYYEYLSMPEKMHYWQKSEEINHMRQKAKEVWVQLPLFFAREQLEQLV